MKRFFSLILLLTGLSLHAQKVGTVNRDSLLQLLPGYTEANNTLQEKKKQIAEERRRMQKELDERIKQQDSLKNKVSPIVNQLFLHEIESLKERIGYFDETSGEYFQYDSLCVAPFLYAFDKAVQTACAKKKCTYDPSPDKDSVKVINLNAEVASLLKSNKQVHAVPRKIGYVNKDSLLRLFPEYKLHKDSTAAALNPLTDWYIWSIDYDIDYHYSDSAVISKVDSIVRRDSMICAPYEKKFTEAWTAAMIESKVFYIYDMEVMRSVWPAGKDVEFVNVNALFAKKLGVD